MRLEYLCLDENFIRSVNNLYVLPRLKFLYLRANKVTEIQDLEGLANIETLVELDLSGNPISRKYGYRWSILQRLPLLDTLDGLPPSAEDREKLEGLIEREPPQPAKVMPERKPVQAGKQLRPAGTFDDNLNYFK